MILRQITAGHFNQGNILKLPAQGCSKTTSRFHSGERSGWEGEKRWGSGEGRGGDPCDLLYRRDEDKDSGGHEVPSVVENAKHVGRPLPQHAVVHHVLPPARTPFNPVRR
jgi:hypothetical protein